MMDWLALWHQLARRFGEDTASEAIFRTLYQPTRQGYVARATLSPTTYAHRVARSLARRAKRAAHHLEDYLDTCTPYDTRTPDTRAEVRQFFTRHPAAFARAGNKGDRGRPMRLGRPPAGGGRA